VRGATRETNREENGEMLNLKLRNFRRFAETDTIAFQSGLTIISGPNGAGKSTLVEAIAYALYGPERGQADEVRADNANDVYVECELTIGGHIVKVRRWSDRVELTVDGVLQVQATPGSKRAAQEHLDRLLDGMTPEQFMRTFIAMQGDTAGLVQAKSAAEVRARRVLIEGILQLDVLNRAAEDQVQCRSEAHSTVVDLGKFVAHELQLDQDAGNVLESFGSAHSITTKTRHAHKFVAAIQKEVEARQEAVGVASNALSAAERELERLEGERDERQDTVTTTQGVFEAQEELSKQYEAFAQPIATLEGQIKQIDGDIDKLEQEITDAGAHADAAEEHQRLQGELDQCKNRLARLPLIKERHEAFQKVEAQRKQLDDDLHAYADADAKLFEAQEREKTAKAEWNRLQDDPTITDERDLQVRKAKLATEKGQTLQARKALLDQPDEARCPTYNEPLSEAARQLRIAELTTILNECLLPGLAQIAEEEQQLQLRRREWQAQKQSAHKTYEDCRQATLGQQRHVDKRDDLQRQLRDSTTECHEAHDAWNGLGERAPYDPDEQRQLKLRMTEVETRRQTLHEQADLYNRLPLLRQQLVYKQEEYLQAQDTLREQSAERDAVGYDPEQHRAAEQAHDDAVECLARAQRYVDNAGLHIKACQAQVQQAGEAVSKAEGYWEQCTEALAAFQREDHLLVLLSEFKDHFFTANTQQVAQRTSELLRHAISDGTILGVQFDEQHRLQYLDGSHVARPIVRRLSGGEKALIGLCLRIALAEQAQTITGTARIRCLILDEVLSSLDEERRDSVQRIFEDVQRRGVFEHVLMITHLDAVKHGWPAHSLEVRKVDSKTSTVIPGSAYLSDTQVVDELEV